MSDPITTLLLQISQDLGEMKAEIRSTNSILVKHVEDDKLLEDRIGQLEIGAAKRKGALGALAAVSAFLGGAVGYIAERFGISFGGH